MITMPVDLAEVMDRLDALFRRFVHTSEEQRVFMVAYVIFTHCYQAFDICPRLYLSSPVPEAGKTTALDMFEAVVARPKASGGMTAADMINVIGEQQPTLLFDEMGEWIGAGRSKYISIINGGHHRSKAFVSKSVGGRSVEVSIFICMIVAALEEIAKPPPFPPAFETRCHKLSMVPPNAAERLLLEKFRVEPEMEEVRRMAAAWARAFIPALRAADPEMPPGLGSRTEDNVRPLLAIADFARADWPERMRAAITKLCVRNEGVAPSDGTAIVRDCYRYFTLRALERTPTVDLTNYLKTSGIRLYRDLNQYSLARKLHPFGIHSKDIRTPEGTKRGYERAQFEDAIERYRINPDDAPEPATSATGATSAAPRRNPEDEYMTLPLVAQELWQLTLTTLADAHPEERARVVEAERQEAERIASEPPPPPPEPVEPAAPQPHTAKKPKAQQAPVAKPDSPTRH